MRGRERIEGQNQEQERLGREKDRERPRGPGRKREKKGKQGRRHLKEKNQPCPHIRNPQCKVRKEMLWAVCLHLLCLGLFDETPSQPASIIHSPADTCPVRGPGAGSGTVGRGCMWMCLRAALPQDRLPLASAGLHQSGRCS